MMLTRPAWQTHRCLLTAGCEVGGCGRVSRRFPCSATWWADCQPGGNPGETPVFPSWRHAHYFPKTLSGCKACSVPGLSNSDNCGVTLDILKTWKPQIINIKWHYIRLFHRRAAESTIGPSIMSLAIIKGVRLLPSIHRHLGRLNVSGKSNSR